MEKQTIEKLLDNVQDACNKPYQTTAYNYLVDYLEHPEWFGNREGRCLIALSIEVLENI